MKLNHYAGIWNKKVDKNAGYCSDHCLVSGELTVSTEFVFVAAPE